MEAENSLESSLIKYESTGCYNSESHNFDLRMKRSDNVFDKAVMSCSLIYLHTSKYSNDHALAKKCVDCNRIICFHGLGPFAIPESELFLKQWIL
jgi:hypothetical protein